MILFAVIPAEDQTHHFYLARLLVKDILRKNQLTTNLGENFPLRIEGSLWKI